MQVFSHFLLPPFRDVKAISLLYYLPAMSDMAAPENILL